VSTDPNRQAIGSGCPIASQIGIVSLLLRSEGAPVDIFEPIYNMAPPGGDTPARLGFIADFLPIFVNARLRSRSDYGLTLAIEGAPAQMTLISATTTIWGVPADSIHDSQRITPYEALHNGGVPETPDGRRSSGLSPTPFLVNPTQCADQQEVRVTATSYALLD